VASYTVYAGAISSSPTDSSGVFGVDVAVNYSVLSSDGSNPGSVGTGAGYIVSFGDSDKDVQAALASAIISNLASAGIAIDKKDVIFLNS
jgi:hypothetical protein